MEIDTVLKLCHTSLLTYFEYHIPLKVKNYFSLPTPSLLYMSFEPQRSPFSYSVLSFQDPNALDVFKKGIDPDSKLRRVHVQVNDTGVRRFFWKRVFHDIATANNSDKLFRGLLSSYLNLKRSTVFSTLGITFEPGEDQASVKVIVAPQYTSKTFFHFLNNIEGDSFCLAGSAGIKNVTGILDTISLNISRGYYGRLRHSYHVDYTLPVFYKDYALQFRCGRSTDYLSRGVLKDSSIQKISLFNETTGIFLVNSKRWARINPLYHSREILEQDSNPNGKIALIGSKMWTLLSKTGTWGTISQITGEVASVEDAGRSASVQGESHSILYPGVFTIDGKAKLVNFENHLSCGVTYPLRKSKISTFDRFYKNNVRGFAQAETSELWYDKALHPAAGNPGFEFLGDYKGDDIYLKNTVKMNLMDTPLLSNLNIVPFFYLTYAYFSGDVFNKRNQLKLQRPLGGIPNSEQSLGRRVRPLVEELKRKGRVSAGIGFYRHMSGAIRAEGVLNLLGLGIDGDKISRFQIRFSVDD